MDLIPIPSENETKQIRAGNKTITFASCIPPLNSSLIELIKTKKRKIRENEPTMKRKNITTLRKFKKNFFIIFIFLMIKVSLGKFWCF